MSGSRKGVKRVATNLKNCQQRNRARCSYRATLMRDKTGWSQIQKQRRRELAAALEEILGSL